MSNDPSKFEFDDSEDASKDLDFEDLENEAPDFPSDFSEEGSSDEGAADAIEDLTDAESAEEGSEDELAEEASGEEGADEDAPEASDETDDSEETDETEEKPRRWWAAVNWDLYTIMLGISLLAVTIACLLLYLELQQYSPFPWWKTSGVVEGM